MGALDDELRSELVRIEALGLLRSLPSTGATELVDLCSNDTLSLSRHARVIGAAKAALDKYGAGARASRLLGGNLEVHAQAEAAAARWLGTEAALCFPSAYQANLGVLTALVGRGDELYCDELVHASIVDAARLTRARVSVFPHGDSAGLERLLSARAGLRARRLVVVESVYSMDGDLADLAALHAACAAHDAWLVVDEAHACGLLGPRGAGGWASLGERAGSAARLAARVIGGGKALGASGAFVAGSRALVDTLLQRARSFVFSTALAPASAAALGQAIELAAAADTEREHVHELARGLARELELAPPAAAIVPVPVGAAEETLRVRDALARAGFAVGAARPPTVAPGTARLRIVLHAHNTLDEVRRCASELRACLPVRPRAPQARRAARARLLVVVGTDTGVGKTVISALLARALRAAGPLCYWKPVQTGEDDDTLTVATLAELESREQVAPLYRFPLPASPHAAAEAAGARIDLERLVERLSELRDDPTRGTLLVELAGGLLVPLDERTTQADLLARTGAELVLVARSGLGTLNHTLLTLEALRARALEPRALFLVGPRHASNPRALRERAQVTAIVEVPPFEPLDARAVATWVREHPLSEFLP